MGNATNWPDEVVIHTDGASRGNPGDASLGLTVLDAEGETLFEYAEALGTQTNNYAEYSAVLKALELASENHVKLLHLRSDSQLLIRQLTGEYKVKSEGLKPLFLACRDVARTIPKVNFEHVRREQNARADKLANMVLDEIF